MLSLGCVVCLSLVAGLAAQGRRTAADSGAIAGQILDGRGTPVASATVTLRRPDFAARSVITDPTGRFRFAGVPAASYTIEVAHPLYVTATRRVTIAPGATVPLTLRLAGAPAPAESERSRAAPGRLPADHARSPAAAADGFAGASAEPLPASPSTASASVAGAHPRYPAPPGYPYLRDTEAYASVEDHDFRATDGHPLSTFSIDVDTASYANVRRFLGDGRLPPADAVRTEELINYFRFDYAKPSGGAPFSVVTEVAAAPWNPKHRLALIGLRARPVDADRMLRRNLVFLIDVSGSMAPPDKLPLIRKAMRMLADTLTAGDRIAIVVYAGTSGLVLPSTGGDRKARIHRAIESLQAGGSTNGGEGILLAYRTARGQFLDGGVNRVILATDGDFNVGVTDQRALLRLIEEERRSGIYLSVLGVGDGNLKDDTMEMLADKGNGNYSYLDSLQEARKVLVAEAGGTLVAVAKDVKVQVEFNPEHVAAYRLIGYENRLLRNKDFNDDRKDAGEMGAGHTVTALYEIVPAGLPFPRVDPLKYRPAPTAPARRSEHANELMTVKLRYKEPDGGASRLVAVAAPNRTAAMSNNIGFAAAVAEFGMLLRSNEHRGDASYGEAAALARRYRGPDEDGYRAEFIRLVELADALTRQARGHSRQR
jgi:Ca-activated chloride channel family protein